MMKFLSVILLISISQILNAQTGEKIKYESNVVKTDFGDETFISNDQNLKIVKIKEYSNRISEISPTGVKLMNGSIYQLEKYPGCKNKNHGYFIYRYENGKVKGQGNFNCGMKEGLWTYYDSIGNIKKIENLSLPNRELFDPQFGWEHALTKSMKDGSYIEFHKNGNIKLEGEYIVMEKLERSDTLQYYDPMTYKLNTKIAKGKFWKPRSFKYGKWNHYDEKGNILKSEVYNKNIFNSPERREIVYGDVK